MSYLPDEELGLTQSISRRDLLHGFGSLAAAAFVPGCTVADAVLEAERAGTQPYPPALTGLRGNHEGSYDVAHRLARDSNTDWGPVSAADDGDYDLVVVGAGLSGLAAAHFYSQERPDARILLLDNHDDFGGHAKRNEFDVDGRTILGYGGSQSLQEPGYFPAVARDLLDELGVDVERLAAAYDQEFFRRHGLAAGIHFNREQWGVDRVVRYELGCLTYLPLAESNLTAAMACAAMPLSHAAQTELLRLLTASKDRLDLAAGAREEYVYGTSYREFLEKHLDITEPQVFAVLLDLGLDLGTGIEGISIGDAIDYGNLPGAAAAGLTGWVPREDYIHHFPDGNATVARLLVRRLIPAAADGSSVDDVVGARFDYGRLDEAGARVRLRLNSTAVNVRHTGEPQSAKRVQVDYVNAGRMTRVSAKHCMLACFNSIIPALCPELPAEQHAALRMAVKSPILYTNVLLRNWRAFKEVGIGAAVGSGNYHPVVMLDYPVSFGGHRHPDDPEQPIVVHMERFPYVHGAGVSPREQRRLGRHQLLATPFDVVEREIRQQLASLLSAGDFDPARDIAGITVNRWAHGYSDGFYDLGDPWYGERDDERRPNVRGRKPFGRITIANADAGANAMFDTAVAEAHRAVAELP